MIPYLLDLTLFGVHVRLPSYGLMLALAFSAAYFLSLHRAMKLDENPRHIENLFLLVVAASVVGARMFHVLFEEPGYYVKNPGKIFALWEGGYTLYGGILASAALILVYCRAKRVPYLQFADIAAPATALGLFLGRTGCFLAGCCWGTPTGLPWGVTFDHPETFALVKHVAVHPTQLYEAFGALAIFAYLTWRFRRRRYQGQIFFEGLLLYAVLRFVIEYFRGDEYRGVVGGIVSYSQLVSLAILPFAAVGIFLFSRVRDYNRR